MLAKKLADCVSTLHQAGLCTGSGGNFSTVIQTNPLQLLISPSGADKGTLRPEDFLLIDENCQVLEGEGKPSAETLLHLEIVKVKGAGAVLHTHSVWNTLLSMEPFLEISGFEMLKALEGNKTHEHTEVIPILGNSQNMPALSKELASSLLEHPDAHAILLAGHGLYTWGADIAQAKRHVEALEFLFEIVGRQRWRT